MWAVRGPYWGIRIASCADGSSIVGRPGQADSLAYDVNRTIQADTQTAPVGLYWRQRRHWRHRVANCHCLFRDGIRAFGRRNFLGLTVDNWTVYKWAIVMCGILRPSRCSLSGKQVDIVDLLSSLLRLNYHVYWICCTLSWASAVTIINLYNFTEDFRVVFRFSHTTTFELIPSCLGFPGALVTVCLIWRFWEINMDGFRREGTLKITSLDFCKFSKIDWWSMNNFYET